eukprot:106588_1
MSLHIMKLLHEKTFIRLFFCFTLLSTYSLISLLNDIHKDIFNQQEITAYYVNVTDVYNDLDVIQLIFTNVSHNISTNVKCDSPSVIGLYQGMKNALRKRGFTIQCSKHQTRRIKHQLKHPRKHKAWKPNTCFFYDHLSHNKSFCNG